MTTNANLYVDQGVDFSITLNLFDNEGNDFDISDQNFKCEIRKVYSSSESIEANVEIVTENSSTYLKLSIPASITENKDPGKYQYDIIMFSENSRVKILEGILFLLPTITKINNN
jgi:hypothetical protein